MDWLTESDRYRRDPDTKYAAFKSQRAAIPAHIVASVNILSDDQFRLLAFIAACNRSAYSPTAKQVTLWRNNPKPADAEYRTVERPGFGYPGGYLPPTYPGAYLPHYPGGTLHRMVDTVTALSKQFAGLQPLFDRVYGSTTYAELVGPLPVEDDEDDEPDQVENDEPDEVQGDEPDGAENDIADCDRGDDG